MMCFIISTLNDPEVACKVPKKKCWQEKCWQVGWIRLVDVRLLALQYQATELSVCYPTLDFPYHKNVVSTGEQLSEPRC